MRQIAEDTFVGYDNQGNKIRAEQLQRWAYNQLAAAPDMYEALKALTFQFAAAVERPYSADTRVYTQANEALSKAEGKDKH